MAIDPLAKISFFSESITGANRRRVGHILRLIRKRRTIHGIVFVCQDLPFGDGTVRVGYCLATQQRLIGFLNRVSQRYGLDRGDTIILTYWVMPLGDFLDDVWRRLGRIEKEWRATLDRQEKERRPEPAGRSEEVPLDLEIREFLAKHLARRKWDRYRISYRDPYEKFLDELEDPPGPIEEGWQVKIFRLDQRRW